MTEIASYGWFHRVWYRCFKMGEIMKVIERNKTGFAMCTCCYELNLNTRPVCTCIPTNNCISLDMLLWCLVTTDWSFK